jgi:hypothetical protein
MINNDLEFIEKRDIDFRQLRKALIKGIIRQFEISAMQIQEVNDYAMLEQILKKVKPRSKLFYLIKRYVKTEGHWKDLPRGKPRSFKE